VQEILTALKVIRLDGVHEDRERMIRFADGNTWATYDAAGDLSDEEKLERWNLSQSKAVCL
jgi:hypothetical protein